MGSCFKCHKELSAESKVYRSDECDQCCADLHVCLNCRFYDLGSYNDCRESNADPVQDKEKANHCDYFELYQGKRTSDKKDQLLNAAEALFKS